MQVLTKEEFMVNKRHYFEKIKNGAIFIYPTDTIYGIGCDAANENAVKKLRIIKGRISRPFSIIVPSKEWLYENCEIMNEETEEWIKKLPGPYTLVLELRDKMSISKHVNNDMQTIGIRIPNHWISDIAAELDAPIVTTSANITGKDVMTSLENLDADIKPKVDFIIYEGEKLGKPSTIVDLTTEITLIHDR